MQWNSWFNESAPGYKVNWPLILIIGIILVLGTTLISKLTKSQTQKTDEEDPALGKKSKTPKQHPADSASQPEARKPMSKSRPNENASGVSKNEGNANPQAEGTRKSTVSAGSQPVQKQKSVPKLMINPVQWKATHTRLDWKSLKPEDMANRVKYALLFGDQHMSDGYGCLTKFRIKDWNKIGSGAGWHFDWWVFPTPRCGQKEYFRVATKPADQRKFYSSLLSDREHMEYFKETCELVANSWVWSLASGGELPTKSEAQKGAVYGIRYYKMCKCLALINKHSGIPSQREWIQSYFGQMTGDFKKSREFDGSIHNKEWKILQSGITNQDLFGWY